MRMNDYQEEAASTAIYPDRHAFVGLTYAVLGLSNESGEVAGKLKKVLRDEHGVLTPERKQDLVAETSDVLWYLAMVADELDTTLEDIAQYNLDKLRSRQQRGTLQGSGDNR